MSNEFGFIFGTILDAFGVTFRMHLDVCGEGASKTSSASIFESFLIESGSKLFAFGYILASGFHIILLFFCSGCGCGLVASASLSDASLLFFLIPFPLHACLFHNSFAHLQCLSSILIPC